MASETRKKYSRSRLGLNITCKAGEVLRKPFYRKYTNTVKREGYVVKRAGQTVRIRPQKSRFLVRAACVKDTGKDSGTSGVLKKKGVLLKFGYAWRLPEDNRREALLRAAGKYGVLDVYTRLDQLAKKFNDAKPRAAKIFASDRQWIARKFKGIKSGGGCLDGSCSA